MCTAHPRCARRTRDVHGAPAMCTAHPRCARPGRGPIGPATSPKPPRAAASLCHRRRVQVMVEPEALAEWSAHARHTGMRLQGRFAALEGDLAPLTRTWHGAAAGGFTARHRQWQGAAAGLFGTLTELAELIDAARANYLAARSANATIWQAQVPSTAVVLHAMAAGDGRGRGRGRIEADLEDIRTAVRALVVAEDDL